jgi:type III secretion protein D
MTSLIVRIFSGKHYGAEIELNPGTWVFGSDDSCDIILSDSSLERRHAALTITENGATFSVAASHLDGKIEALDRENAPLTELTALTPYKMGSVIFAWMKAPAEPSDWESVLDALRIGNRPASQAAEQSGTAPAAGDAAEASEGGEAKPEETDDTVSAEEQEAAPQQAELDPEKSEQLKREQLESEKKSAKRMLVAGLGASALVLVLGLFGIFMATSNSGNSPEDSIRRALADSGFADLSVTENSDARFLVTGTVPNDDQRGRLIRLTQMLPYPTDIRVSVDSDLTDAIQSGFNAQDFWPDVSIEKGKGKKRELLVKGYIQNEQTESKAFEKALSNVPLILRQQNSPRITRSIRYERDLRPMVGKAFDSPVLSNTQVAYLPGRLEVRLPLTPEREESLAKAIGKLREMAGVPLLIDIKNVEDKLAAAAVKTQTAGAAPQSVAKPKQTDGFPFRIVSTSMGVLRFVKLANGDRVFEGGRLPGGYTLVRVMPDKLALSRDGKRFTYPLRIRK